MILLRTLLWSAVKFFIQFRHAMGYLSWQDCVGQKQTSSTGQTLNAINLSSSDLLFISCTTSTPRLLGMFLVISLFIIIHQMWSFAKPWLLFQFNWRKKKQREYYVCVCVWARNRVPFEWTNHHHHSFNLPITNRTNSLMKTMNIKTTIQRNKPNTLWSPDWFNGFNWLEMLQLTVAENFNFDNHFFVVVFLIS